MSTFILHSTVITLGFGQAVLESLQLCLKSHLDSTASKTGKICIVMMMNINRIFFLNVLKKLLTWVAPSCFSIFNEHFLHHVKTV